MSDQTVTVLHARGVLDVDTGEVIDGAYVVVEGNRIASVDTDSGVTRDADEVIELPELTLIPGLMDMEVDLVLGGPGAGLTDPVVTDPVKMTLRAAANARRTLRAGFTTVRNLGLFVKTGGYLLDVALSEAIDAGWVEGPRVVPAGHAICPTGGHLDPSAQSGLAPHMMPLSVEEGIADGVDEIRRAVRYQIKHGAKLIKCVASGGVMSPTGVPGAQQYSDEELAAIADEAHRRGLKVATHCHGDVAVNAALDAGIDCIEHGFMMTAPTIQRMVDTGTFLVSTNALDPELGRVASAAGVAGQGGRGVPQGQAVAVGRHRSRRQDRLRHRRPGHLARPQRRGARRPRRARHDSAAGHPRRHDGQRRAHRRARSRAHRTRDARRHRRRPR